MKQNEPKEIKNLSKRKRLKSQLFQLTVGQDKMNMQEFPSETLILVKKKLTMQLKIRAMQGQTGFTSLANQNPELENDITFVHEHFGRFPAIDPPHTRKYAKR